MIQAPIFHVNGDDPEAVVRVGRLAFDYRQAFRKDVVIDMICYRRRGHNEADNPSFTQPLMYDLIDAKRSTRKLYTEALIGRGDITMEEAEQALRDYQQQLERAFTETREAANQLAVPGRGHPAGTCRAGGDRPHCRAHARSPTRPSSRSSTASSTCPTASPSIRGCSRCWQRRAAMVAERTRSTGPPVNCWPSASVLMDGHTVRLVGQDTRRGTFGQRHAVLVDRHTGAEYTPLRRFNSASAQFHVYDSLLSEFAAVGFEYGYSVARPGALVCWEAQFGDFVNGAQTIMDEFVTSGEQKWGQRSSVVLLLPHGYEGQGPDHSSARVERFLTLCAQDNMTVAMPTTPANYFHLLRWQALGARRKPLIVFTPKSMLRLKVGHVQHGRVHQGIVPSGDRRPPSGRPGRACAPCCCAPARSTTTSLHRRAAEGRDDVALIRVERLYPLPLGEILAELDRYPAEAEIAWVQEEPTNMGAWPTMALWLPGLLERKIRLVAPPASSAPALGSSIAHAADHKAVIERALGLG